MNRFSPSQLSRFFTHEIWQPALLNERSVRGNFYAVLRVVSITITGMGESRITSRAAALSFSTLLGLGPLIGLAALIAGFAMGKNDPALISQKIGELLRFVAPSVNQYEQVSVNPELVNLINNFIAGTRHSAGGIISIISIIAVVLLLFTSVEQVFNDIWGVRRGRSWLLRIVFYWTILTLGAVVFFGAVGALSAATFISFFSEKLHLTKAMTDALTYALPAFSLSLLVGILTIFYRYIPNTQVFWRAALVGATIVALLLVGNNLLAFFYLQRIDFTRSLYGSLGMLPILMFGLYIFWLFILVGGQLSYAVQNVHFRSSQAAWSNLTESTRERLTLAVLLTIARRFQACQPPCNVSALGSTIKVPTQILNECLNRLVDLQLVSMVPPGPHANASDYLYQPARPLNRMSLGDFKHRFENHGEDPAGNGLAQLDPVLSRYHETFKEQENQAFFTSSLEELFDEHPFSESKSPLAVEDGQKTKPA
ncbi:MAG: YihY/virulence factor BrkB family protein [Verrucomicrobia bacterium]|nr:YihY/virulence factor BrkB family protein [Verrucomicrobiota bacterium]